jgi:hypothetical protein
MCFTPSQARTRRLYDGLPTPLPTSSCIARHDSSTAAQWAQATSLSFSARFALHVSEQGPSKFRILGVHAENRVGRQAGDDRAA